MLVAAKVPAVAGLLDEMRLVYEAKAARSTILCASLLGEYLINRIVQEERSSLRLPDMERGSENSDRLFFLRTFGRLNDAAFYCLTAVRRIGNAARHDVEATLGPHLDAVLAMLARGLCEALDLKLSRESKFSWQNGWGGDRALLLSHIPDRLDKAREIIEKSTDPNLPMDSWLLCLAAESFLHETHLPRKLRVWLQGMDARLSRGRERMHLGLRVKELMALSHRRGGDPQMGARILERHIGRWGIRLRTAEAEEVFGILGACYKAMWAKEPHRRDLLEKACETYKQAADITRAPYTNINAATLYYLRAKLDPGATASHLEKSRIYAERVLKALEGHPFAEKDPWLAASLAEALFVIGTDEDEARRAYQRAFAAFGRRVLDKKSAQTQLQVLLDRRNPPMTVEAFLTQ